MVCSLAVRGSKFRGSSFDSEQIGHTQLIARDPGGFGERRGLPSPWLLGNGEEELLRPGDCSPSGVRVRKALGRLSLGYSVTFGEDLRNPAWFKISFSPAG